MNMINPNNDYVALLSYLEKINGYYHGASNYETTNKYWPTGDMEETKLGTNNVQINVIVKNTDFVYFLEMVTHYSKQTKTYPSYYMHISIQHIIRFIKMSHTHHQIQMSQIFKVMALLTH